MEVAAMACVSLGRLAPGRLGYYLVKRCERVERRDPGHAPLASHDNHLGTARERRALRAARGGATPQALQRINNLAGRVGPDGRAERAERAERAIRMRPQGWAARPHEGGHGRADEGRAEERGHNCHDDHRAGKLRRQ